jgi:hypothetical protein
LLSCVLEDVPELYLKEHEKTLYCITKHNAKPKTVCNQQKENDEDITSLDMTILVTFDSKVKQFFIMSICNTFDELMLHHDVCLISLLHVLTWMKESIGCLWKIWRTKYVDWGRNPTPPHVSPQGYHVTFHPRKERDKFQYILKSLIWTAEQYKLATATTISYEFRLGHIITC